MKLFSSRGLNSSGSDTNTSGIDTLKKIKLEPDFIRIPWNMSKRILVGKRSDGYQIMQALAPIIQMGWFLHIEKGESEPLKVTLFNEKGSPKRKGEGTTLSVALRRMSVGLSKEFSHMME